MGEMDIIKWVVGSASKMELSGLVGTVEFKNQLHVGEAGFSDESQCPIDDAEIVSVIRGGCPFFQRLEILAGWRVS